MLIVELGFLRFILFNTGDKNIGNKTGKYINCEYCGAEVYKTLSQYNKRTHHYCSNKCQAMHKQTFTHEHRRCEVCGSDMYLSKKSTQRFCSYACQNEWQKSNTGFKNKKFQGKLVTCESCGAEFLVGKTIADSSRHHFCSVDCRQSWYSTVWSQTNEWKQESRERAAKLLSDNKVITMTKPQVIVNQLLDVLEIKYENEKSFKFYSADNYLCDYGLIIEVMGDYWHTSPLRYPIIKNDKQSFIISRDKAKRTYIYNNYGISILYLWEGDIMTRPDLCKELIRCYVSCGGVLNNYNSFNYSLVEGRLKINDDIIYSHQERDPEIAR